jgi:hypothetical protein
MPSWKLAPSGRRGAQRKFSDHAIETALTLDKVEGDTTSITAAYDTLAVYCAAAERNAKVVVPPIKTETNSRRLRSRSSARDRNSQGCSYQLWISGNTSEANRRMLASASA